MWYEMGILVDVENMIFKIVYIDPNEEVVDLPFLEGGTFTVARKFDIDGYPIEEY